MEYTRVTPQQGETFLKVTQRVGIPYYSGSGYYQLIKSEKISTKKDLVLHINDDNDEEDCWIAGCATVRTKLGVGLGNITIQPKDIPTGWELFVQSTSHNRKLPHGHDILFRMSANLTDDGGGAVSVQPFNSAGAVGGATTAAVAAAASSSSSSKKASKPSKRKRGGAGGDDGSSGDKRNKKKKKIVVWEKLLFTVNEPVECLDEDSLVIGASESNVPGDCDLPIPANLVQDTISMIYKNVVQVVTHWTVTETVVIVPPTSPYGGGLSFSRHQWKAGSSHSNIRLVYVHSENATFIALEIPHEEYGIVCGNCGAHPFVHTPHYMYSNSDGSSRDIPLPNDYITPETVVSKLIHDLVLHCNNSEH